MGTMSAIKCKIRNFPSMNFSHSVTVKTADDTVKTETLARLFARSPKTVLYFYPKDNTPGCTTEAQEFTALKDRFAQSGVQIVGVSSDSAASHQKFGISCALGIDLISDDDGELHRMFGAIGEKNNYGKISVGVIRSTFLLDVSGNVLREWRNVSAAGHAGKVLESL